MNIKRNHPYVVWVTLVGLWGIDLEQPWTKQVALQAGHLSGLWGWTCVLHGCAPGIWSRCPGLRVFSGVPRKVPTMAAFGKMEIRIIAPLLSTSANAERALPLLCKETDMQWELTLESMAFWDTCSSSACSGLMLIFSLGFGFEDIPLPQL